ncbi:MAG: DUF2283 domain-containing protein [Candidatus Omnitrophota bacterium]
MDKVTVYYHKESDTMDVWFGDPKNEHSCEEVGEGVILKKDKDGHVIGFEKLYMHKVLNLPLADTPLPFEVVVS